MRTMLDFAASCQAMPDALQKSQLKGVKAAALYVVRGIRTEILAATGDNRLSGVGKKGARVGAKYDVKGSVNPTALIKATGPLHLIEHDTGAHDIKPRKRRGKKAALKFPDGGFAKNAPHPGTRAKRPFAKGVAKTADRAPEIYNEQLFKAISTVFSG